MAEYLSSRRDRGDAVALVLQPRGHYRVAYSNAEFARTLQEACDSTTALLPRGIPNLSILPDGTTAVGTTARAALRGAKQTNKSNGIFVKKAASPHGTKLGKMSKWDRARAEGLLLLLLLQEEAQQQRI